MENVNSEEYSKKSNSTNKQIYLKGSVQWFKISQIEFQSKKMFLGSLVSGLSPNTAAGCSPG